MSKFAVILALTAAIAEAVSLHSRLQAIDFENNLA